MDNKEVARMLIEYLLKQDPKDVAKALAACMIDFNRLMHAEILGDNERENLFLRIRMNVEELYKFLRNPDDEKFCIIRKDSNEDE